MTGRQLKKASTARVVASPNAPLNFHRVMQTLLVPDLERRRWSAVTHLLRGFRLDADCWTDPQQHAPEARRALEIIRCTLVDIEVARSIMADATREPCEAKRLGMLLAGLVDGFPNARPASVEGYVDGLHLTIWQRIEAERANHPRSRAARTSAQVVAAAVSKAWAECRFPPSPSEMLQFCADVREGFDRVQVVLQEISHLRYHAESVLITSGELAEFSDDEPGGGDELRAEYQALLRKRLAVSQDQQPQRPEIVTAVHPTTEEDAS